MAQLILLFIPLNLCSKDRATPGGLPRLYPRLIKDIKPNFMDEQSFDTDARIREAIVKSLNTPLL